MNILDNQIQVYQSPYSDCKDISIVYDLSTQLPISIEVTDLAARSNFRLYQEVGSVMADRIFENLSSDLNVDSKNKVEFLWKETGLRFYLGKNLCDTFSLKERLENSDFHFESGERGDEKERLVRLCLQEIISKVESDFYQIKKMCSSPLVLESKIHEYSELNINLFEDKMSFESILYCFFQLANIAKVSCESFFEKDSEILSCVSGFKKNINILRSVEWVFSEKRIVFFNGLNSLDINFIFNPSFIVGVEKIVRIFELFNSLQLFFVVDECLNFEFGKNSISKLDVIADKLGAVAMLETATKSLFKEYCEDGKVTVGKGLDFLASVSLVIILVTFDEEINMTFAVAVVLASLASIAKKVGYFNDQEIWKRAVQ